MSFPLGLFLNIEYHLNSLVLFSLTHMLYLEATTERCSLKYVFFKTRETWHTEQRYEHITIIEKFNIVILVM